MTSTSYTIAWAIYLFSAIGLSAILWKISSAWRRLELQYVARIAFIIIVVTPYYSDAEQNRMAPAILISLFELAFGNQDIGIHAGKPLLALLLIVFGISLVLNLTRRNKNSL